MAIQFQNFLTKLKTDSGLVPLSFNIHQSTISNSKGEPKGDLNWILAFLNPPLIPPLIFKIYTFNSCHAIKACLPSGRGDSL